MTDFAIRPFTPDDLMDVIQVEKNVYGSAAYLPVFLRQLYDLAPDLIQVATAGDFVVGHICGAMAADGVTGWVLNVAVVARYRRQGLACQLFETLLARLRDAGVKRVRTTAEDDNKAARHLYGKMGFRDVGSEANYYGDGGDRRIFELEFSA